MEEHPEYLDYPNVEELVVFIINGNQGSHEQFPLIANQMAKYFNKLTESQKKGMIDPEFRNHDKKTYYRLRTYGWNTFRQPSAFSGAMFKDQALYVQESIKAMLRDRYEGDQRFTIIGHSIGCLTAYFIQDQVSEYGNLQNIICLGTPFGESPTKLNKDLENILSEIKAKKQENQQKHSTYNFIFNSGDKDFHIPSEKAGEDRFESYLPEDRTIVVNVDRDLKHFYSSLNHASFFFSKHFHNTFSVFASKVMLARDPMRSAREQLFLLHDEPLKHGEFQPVEMDECSSQL